MMVVVVVVVVFFSKVANRISYIQLMYADAILA